MFDLWLIISSLCVRHCCSSSFLNLGLMSNDRNDKTPSDYEVTGEVCLETAKKSPFLFLYSIHQVHTIILAWQCTRFFV